MYHIIFPVLCQRSAYYSAGDTAFSSVCSPICRITLPLILTRKITVIVRDITSAIGNAHHT